MDATFPVSDAAPAGAALWLHPTDLSRSLVVGANGDAGLVLYALDGSVRGSIGKGRSDFVAVAYGFDAGAGAGALLVAQDLPAGALRAWTIDAAGKPRELTTAPLVVGDELTGLCLYRSALSGKFYAFAATGSGQLQQWELSPQRGGVRGRIVRSIPVGSGIGPCAVDEADDAVYVADESVGIWRIAAEPEADLAERRLLDLTAPRGQLGEEAKGIAIVASGETRYLLAADEEAAAVDVYALPEGRHVGQFQPTLDKPAFDAITRLRFRAAAARGWPGTGRG